MIGNVNVTMYAFDVRIIPANYEFITYIALTAAQNIPLTSRTMGSEAVSYQIGPVSLVLIPTEALTPMYWRQALFMMRNKGRELGCWGFSFQICDERSGTEIGSGRLKQRLSTSHVLSNET